MMEDPHEKLDDLDEAEKDILRGIIRKQKKQLQDGASA